MVDVFTIEISIYAVLALKNYKWFLTNFHISVICNHQVAGTISSHGHIWLKDAKGPKQSGNYHRALLSYQRGTDSAWTPNTPGTCGW
jgi:hypothetical protein